MIKPIIITIIANQRGLNDAAAVGIVEKVISFLFLVPSSMLSTVSALGAQNIGAGKPERAIQTLRYAVMLAAGFGVLASIRGYTSPATPRRSAPISPRGRSRAILQAILQIARSLCVSAA